MATAQQQRANGATNYAAESDTPNLDKAIAATPIRIVSDRLDGRLQTLEDLLPDYLKGQGKRLIKRSLLFLSRKPDILKCTPESIVQGICNAAELGIAIDGRMAHLSPFNTCVKEKGKPDRWEERAQLMLDWKVLLSLAKRSGLITDGTTDVVYSGDEFDYYRENGRNFIKHRPAKLGTDRGTPLGYYASFVLPSGGCDFEVMDWATVDKIRLSSKSKDSAAWRNWFDEMGRKCPLRRGLKRYSDDPTLQRAIEIDEEEFNVDTEPVPHRGPTHGVSRADRMARQEQAAAELLAPRTQAVKQSEVIEAAQEFITDEPPTLETGRHSEASAADSKASVDSAIAGEIPSARKPRVEKSDEEMLAFESCLVEATTQESIAEQVRAFKDRHADDPARMEKATALGGYYWKRLKDLRPLEK